MKCIKQYTMTDEIPSSAKYLTSRYVEKEYHGVKHPPELFFFYEVTIKKESTAPNIDVEGIVVDVIAYLNESTGKNFKPVGKNAQLIRDRIKTDKATTEDFMRCIDNMTAEWDDDPKMKQYLRPATLFSASKFDGYVNHRTTGQDAADAFSDLESFIND